MEKEKKSMMLNAQSPNFEKFMATYQGQVFRYAMRLTGNRSDAEDLTQETFFRAYRSFEKGNHDKVGVRWLHHILLNVFLDQRRKENRRPKTTSADALYEDNALIEPVDTTFDPERALFSNELSHQLKLALAQLPEAKQEIIRQAIFEEISYAKLSELWGCQVATVKTRVHRALRALRQHLHVIDPQFAASKKIAIA